MILMILFSSTDIKAQKGSPPVEGSLRLVNGTSCAGRAEVFLQGDWRTVCDFLRVVNGAGFCSGRVQVKTNQSWISVCEDDFDWLDAEVACRELGCGTPLVLQRGLYGEAEGLIGSVEFQCNGNEDLLQKCDIVVRKNKPCSSGKAVGLTCSGPDDVRLVGGGSRCAGRVEWNQQRDGIVWSVGPKYMWNNVAGVVCRQLGCGSTVKTLLGEITEGFYFLCDGSEPALRECVGNHVEPMFLPSLKVICSDLLLQPDIYVSVSIDEGHQDPSKVFRGHSFTISCSTQPQYPGGSFFLMFSNSNTTLIQTQPAVNHSADFLFPAADHSHQGNYSCIYEIYVFSHNFSSESKLLPLTITTSPVTVTAVMRLVVLLMFVTANIATYLYLKITKKQSQVEGVNLEVISLKPRAKARLREESAAQETE
ncbi:hypothetical protein UPYG_G00338940 [Umbra pygmaea]|uniref:SRCR domain-containing protein n=1 Tax=Umbra pygmaea TaxID=75934 RepID=A0ABD0VXS4_UMBPY